MTPDELYRQLQRELDSFEAAQTFKYEVPLEGEQGGTVPVRGTFKVFDECSGWLVNYLTL